MKKRLICLAVALMTLFAAFTACGKKSQSEEGVYVVGADFGADYAIGRTCYAVLWKNGLDQPVSDEGYFGRWCDYDDDDNTLYLVKSVFVSGTDVYVAGNGEGENRVLFATLWKNGKAQRLSAGDGGSEARSVFVSGDDVYVAGGVRNAQWHMAATLWKNGAPQRLSGGYGDSQARSVFVSGDDVYVAGVVSNAQGDTTAALWKNGKAQRLSAADGGSEARSVFVSGDDVYVAGVRRNAQGNTAATLWKNGAAQRLGNGEANSVYVSGGDVYVAGREISGKFGFATFWKNGVSQRLSAGLGMGANSVFVSGGDVYVAGSELAPQIPAFPETGGAYKVQVATLWKNGKPRRLGIGGGAAASVFVTPGAVWKIEDEEEPNKNEGGHSQEEIIAEYEALKREQEPAAKPGEQQAAIKTLSFDEAYNKGVSLCNAGKLSEAKGYLNRAVATNPGFADSYYFLGICEFRGGNIKAAKSNLQRYLQLAPNGQYAAIVIEMLNNPVFNAAG